MSSIEGRQGLSRESLQPKAEMAMEQMDTLQREMAALEVAADRAAKEAQRTEVSAEHRETFEKEVQSATERFKIKLRSLSRAAVFSTALLASSSALPPKETFHDMKDRARTELATKGITGEQRHGYIRGVNDLLYKAIVPRGYVFSSYGPGHAQDRSETVDENPLTVTKDILERVYAGLVQERRIEEPEREDAWRLYLGMPQKNGTFGISEYQPTRSKGGTYYYKFNNPLFLLGGDDRNHEFYGQKPSDTIKRIVNTLKGSEKRSVTKQDKIALQHYQWSAGEDERGSYVAYYDIWDLNVPTVTGGTMFGKGFEIYDRIYYDPKTFEIIPYTLTRNGDPL